MLKRLIPVGSVACAFVLMLTSPATTALAQTTPMSQMQGASPATLLPFAKFDPAIPTQKEVTGVAPGARPLRHAELLGYFEALAEASPRARLLTYAHTHEGRRMVYLAIGDEATIADLDTLRADQAKRFDPRGRTTAEDAAALAPAKAVAWMGYSIHGDELSGADASAVLAYWLVAGEDDRARALRDRVLTLIDPMQNPDGRDRFLAQTASFGHASPNPDPEDLSHTTVWPWGRGNHYLFDLNRDWFSLVQPESARSEVIAGWNPQLVLDVHEMGSDDTFLFPPPRHPFNPHMAESLHHWTDVISADQARALDERGFAYYTGEWNEEFFPGYGSTWILYLGAIGVLHEMSSTEGTLVTQSAGTVRTYAEGVEHQLASSIANLETLSDNRDAILRDFIGGRREAVRQGVEGPVRAWILPPGRLPERTDALATLLARLGIEVLRSEAPASADGLIDARTGARSRRELPAGTWMVPLDQPAAPLARVLLDPHVPMETEFLSEEREHQERGKGTRLYETTSWSLPLAYGVDAYWSERKPAGNWKRPAPDEAGGSSGSLETPAEVYGYLFDGAGDNAAPAVGELLARGIALRVAEKPFRVNGRDYGRGTLLIKREGNPDDLVAVLQDVAEGRHLDIHATPTARAENGPDLGGNHFQPLVAPRIGVWTGMPVSPSQYGALWHLLDKQTGLRFNNLDLAGFRRTDLSRYNVLVFPPAFGGARSYRSMLGDGGVEQLETWVQAGGTAIGIGSGAEFLADNDLALTATRLRRQALDKFPPAVLSLSAEEVARAGTFRAVGLRPAQEDGAAAQSGSSKPAAGVATAQRGSPYDVAPIIGAGARPFTRGFGLGTPLDLKPVALDQWVKPFLPPGKSSPEKEDLERADERLRRFSPQGVLLRVELDPEVWLNWGLPDEVTAFVSASDALVADAPVTVAARFPEVDRLHLSGLLWPEAAGRLAETAYVTREGVGRGQVILFLDNPAFRGWMRDTARLFLNSVLYGPGLGTRWSSPW